jgi:hypothetical protein
VWTQGGVTRNEPRDPVSLASHTRDPEFQVRRLPTSRFPPSPTALGNRSAIPTFPPRRRFFSFLPKTNPKGPPPLSNLTAPAQAHPSMRKCSDALSIYDIHDTMHTDVTRVAVYLGARTKSVWRLSYPRRINEASA